MESEGDAEIRELAYRIWQEEGYPYGQEVQHWLKAEAIWQEKHRSKSKPKRSKSIKSKESRQTSAAERDL
jgi:hypothetical protein